MKTQILNHENHKIWDQQTWFFMKAQVFPGSLTSAWVMFYDERIEMAQWSPAPCGASVQPEDPLIFIAGYPLLFIDGYPSMNIQFLEIQFFEIQFHGKP